MKEALAAVEANWQIYGGVALLALLVVWWLLARASKRTRTREYQPDVLDEGVAPAARNQALIDAAPAAQVVMPPVMPAPPPPPAEPVPERRPIPEVIAEPVPMPGLDQAASPDQTADEEQRPDSVSEGEVAPEAEPERAPVAATPAPPPAGDDLSKIKGLGPKLQTLLPTLGLNTYAQIAALTEADLVKLDPQLGPFAGRPTRDGWVEQARYLAAGDTAGFEARFGKV